MYLKYCQLSSREKNLYPDNVLEIKVGIDVRGDLLVGFDNLAQIDVDKVVVRVNMLLH